MKRHLNFLLSLALCAALVLPAQAQNYVVPTAPNGTNNNQAASTAFVQNALAGGSSVACAALPALTGAVTTSAGSCTTAIAATGVVGGTYGDATHVPQITINAAGQITSATSVAVAGITALTGDVTATGPGSAAATLATVNSNVGTFGSATQCVTLTVNAKGLVTGASAATCTPAFSSITGTPTTLAGYGITSPLPVAQGGTASASASGTALDNITGFSSTGFINRTGAGAYSFVGSTGSGNVVLATSPTLVTPTLGVASATSLTAANIYGGSSAGSTLNLQSTSSGSPSGDTVTVTAGGSARITALSNGHLGFGDTNPQRPFIFNMNTAQGVAITGWQGFNVYSPDSVAGIGINLLHIASAGGFTDARVNGTLASPSNLNSGDQFAHFGGSGWGIGAFHGDAISIDGFATENWTTSYGSYMKLSATPNGSTVNVQAMRLQAGVIVGQGTVDPGSQNLLVNGKLTVGNDTNPQVQLVVSANVTTGIVGPTGDIAKFVAVDGGSTVVGLETYGVVGAANQSTLALDAARNTAATPQALQSGDAMGQVGWRGYDGAAWSNFRIRVFGFATENWSSTNRGSGFEFDTTAAGGNVRSQALRVVNGVIVGAGTSDPGAGNLTASGTVQGAGLLSNGDPGGTASNTTITNTNSTTISTGTGTVKMSSANSANNAVWLKIYIGTTAYWVPGWTTNSP